MSELTLQQVSYRYPGGSRYALDGISGTFFRREAVRRHRPLWQRQEHAPEPDGGAGPAYRGLPAAQRSDYRSLNLDRCRRQEIAMIFQAFQLFPLLTVLENVCFPWRPMGSSKKEAKAKAKELPHLWAFRRSSISGTPRTFPAGGSSGWPLPAPCPPVQGSFWPTSPRATWTRPTATK